MKMFRLKMFSLIAAALLCACSLKPDGSIDHFTMAAVSPIADFSFDYQDLYFRPALSAPIVGK
jgi:hypothetical protein